MNKCQAQGMNVGAFVVGMAERELPEICESINRDKTATKVELPIAMAWATAMALGRAGTDEEVIQTMFGFMSEHVSRISGWSPTVATAVLGDRLEEYNTAFTASDESMQNVAKLFTACCERVRERVRYNELIPSPDDLEVVSDQLEPRVIEAIRKLQRKGRPTFSLNMMATMAVTTTIFAVAEAAKRIPASGEGPFRA